MSSDRSEPLPSKAISRSLTDSCNTHADADLLPGRETERAEAETPATRMLDCEPPVAWPGLSANAVSALDSRFELFELIGRGGMGAVYRARHRTLDLQVAIKVTNFGMSSARFLREARLLAQVRSPHIVCVHDCDILPDGTPFLVMEFVEGQNLQQLLHQRAEPLIESEAVEWMRHVSDGMDAAAEMGIIHRDLKPANVLIDATGHARVADFGLARSRKQSSDETLAAGGIMGTPHYMAPEQAEDSRGVDTRADVYSFGATFYHALTGAPPFDGPSVFSILFKHKTEPLIPPHVRNPRLSSRVSELLERCLAKGPKDRFQSFADLRRQLDATGSSPSPWDVDNDPALATYLTRYQERRFAYLAQRDSIAPDGEVYEFPAGRILRVVAGDIARQETDALVSSDDGQLSMSDSIRPGTGAAAALRRAGGPAYFAAAQSFAPVRAGRVVVTPAGGLKARFVFHGVTLDSRREQRVCPSRDLIAEILASCFHHADTHFVQTIAFPLLATGTAGFSQEICLDMTFRYLARTLLHGITSVREARIVLHRPGGTCPEQQQNAT